MEKYRDLEMEIIFFENEDIITSSNSTVNDIETPEIPVT